MKSLKILLVGVNSNKGLDLVKLWLNNGHKVIVNFSDTKILLELIELKNIYYNRLVILEIEKFLHGHFDFQLQETINTFGNLDRYFILPQES